MKTRYMILLILGLIFLGCTGDKKDTVNYSEAEEMVEPAPPVHHYEREEMVAGSSPIDSVDIGDPTVEEKDVTLHTYTIIKHPDELEKLKDVMTYVLLPHDISGQVLGQGTAKSKRYIRVLELIQELPKIESTVLLDENITLPTTMNKFIVLGKESAGEGKITIENYNYQAANSVLDFFKQKVKEEMQTLLFHGEGPFLITTTENVLLNGKDFTFLYVDLSKFNNSAIKQAVENYKKRLLLQGTADVRILEELSYRLLSFATNLNSDIHILHAAFAGE
ncbi:MAG: hypothetical protein K0U38_03160 [Epsilonproteobacteria bacterium]|nr:hypothetical protein [Campylobacterota bacterium]